MDERRNGSDTETVGPAPARWRPPFDGACKLTGCLLLLLSGLYILGNAAWAFGDLALQRLSGWRVTDLHWFAAMAQSLLGIARMLPVLVLAFVFAMAGVIAGRASRGRSDSSRRRVDRGGGPSGQNPGVKADR